MSHSGFLFRFVICLFIHNKTDKGNAQNDLLVVIQQAAIGLIVANKASRIKHMNQMAEKMVLPLFKD